MTDQEAKDLQEKIMGFCRKLQRENPGWMFARCFSEAQRQHPEWFKDGEATRDAIDLGQKEMQDQKQQIALRQQKEQLQTFNRVNGSESEANPKNVKEVADQELQETIKAEVANIQQRHPGLGFAAAYGILRAQRPGLFLGPEDTDKAEADNLEMHPLMPGDKKSALAQRLMEHHHGLSFVDALDHVRRTRPELFDSDSLTALRKSMSHA